MFLARLSALCFLIIQSAAVPPEECFANFRWDDCGKPPEPVIYYWKPGSRCEVGTWRGCVPNPNMFKNEYECVETCVFNAKRNELRQENLDKIIKPPDSVESMENINEKENVNLSEIEKTSLTDSGFSQTTVANDDLATLVSDKMSSFNGTMISNDTFLSNETLMTSYKLASNVDGKTFDSNDSFVNDNDSLASNENLVANKTISSNNTMTADDTPASNHSLVHNETVGFNKTDVHEDEVDEKEIADNKHKEIVDNKTEEADKPEGRSRLARLLKEN